MARSIPVRFTRCRRPLAAAVIVASAAACSSSQPIRSGPVSTRNTRQASPAGSASAGPAASAAMEHGRELARAVFQAYSRERCWASNFTQWSCRECRVEGTLRTQNHRKLVWKVPGRPPLTVSLLGSEGHTKYTVGFLTPEFLDSFQFSALPGSRVLHASPRSTPEISEVRYVVDPEQRVTASVVVLDAGGNELRTRFRHWSSHCDVEGAGTDGTLQH